MRNPSRLPALAMCALVALMLAIPSAFLGRSSAQSEYGPPYPPGQNYPAAEDQSPKAIQIRKLVERYKTLERLQDHAVVQENIGRTRSDSRGSFIEGHGRTLEEYFPARAAMDACEFAREITEVQTKCARAKVDIALCVAKRDGWARDKAAVLSEAAPIDNKYLKTSMWLLGKLELLPCPSSSSLEGWTPDEVIEHFKDAQQSIADAQWCDREEKDIKGLISAGSWGVAETRIHDFALKCTAARAKPLQDALDAARPKPVPAAPPVAPAVAPPIAPPNPSQQAQIDALKLQLEQALAAAQPKVPTWQEAALANQMAKSKAQDAALEAWNLEKEEAKFELSLETIADGGELFALAQKMADEGKLGRMRLALQALARRFPKSDLTVIGADQLVSLQDKETAAAAAAAARAAQDAADRAAQQAAQDAAARAAGDRAQVPQTPPAPAFDRNKKIEQCSAEFNAKGYGTRLDTFIASTTENLLRMRATVATIDLQMEYARGCSGDPRTAGILADMANLRKATLAACERISTNSSMCLVSPWK